MSDIIYLKNVLSLLCIYTNIYPTLV